MKDSPAELWQKHHFEAAFWKSIPVQVNGRDPCTKTEMEPKVLTEIAILSAKCSADFAS
jgi:hypothetical protein